MKIRTDFVTNSSSSSYVIAFKQEGLDQLKEALKNVPDILKSAVKVFNGMFLDGAEYLVKNKDELNEYFLERHGWSKHKTIDDLLNDEDMEWEIEEYNKYLNYINNGFAIIEHNVDYSDESKSDFLSGLHDGVNFINLEVD